MRSCLYDRVFLAPTAKEVRGWKPGNDNRHNSAPSDHSKISIAWWLVPSMVVCVVASSWIFG